MSACCEAVHDNEMDIVEVIVSRLVGTADDESKQTYCRTVR